MDNPKNSNPFAQEDDDFDDLSNDPELNSVKQQKDYYRQQMVASSNRSVRMIAESQATAIETAEELRKQREQLERTNKNLDKMNDDLNQSERHITSLKSIWGTMSNWFKKPVESSQPVDKPTRNQDSDASLKATNQEIQNNLKQLDKVNLTFDSNHTRNNLSSGEFNPRLTTNEDEIVDNNLDQLLAGLTVLKGHGLALGNEIDEQNQLLDDIHQKAGRMDDKVELQNKRINKILR